MLMYDEFTNLTFFGNIAVAFLIRLLSFNNGFMVMQDLYYGYRKENNDQQERYRLAIL
jgi:hypothetical protein